MIIGISGAQGQGKSTLINKASENNSLFLSAPVQTSRELLNDWGYTLGEINNYIPLKIKFQEELLDRHIFKMCDLSTQSRVYLVERTFADIFAYAILSVGPFNDYSEWLDSYYQKCANAQKTFFSHVIYLSGRVYVPETDGVRSTNVHFARLADNCIRQYTEEFATNSNYSVIQNPDITSRINLLNNIVRQYGDDVCMSNQ